ncbi:NAD-dependent epimerase/dehydratase family protein [Candidatus Uhrbacteria bacterium]|nr:NAD-dependent epimerase/dehydratase family protein [Candidatus Uhrbacteria bacterium]
MHYLVTGGAGFIGSNLVEALLRAGHRVRILDNFSTGKRSNVAADAELVEADLTDLEKIRPAFRGMDGVFHLAALPRVPFSIEHPIESNAANVTGTLHVLEAAREAGVKRVVYSASSSAYGDQPTLPLHEEMKTAPKNPYGLQKYVGEEYARVYAECYPLETVSLRYFNVYGPRMADEGAYVTIISIFVRQRKAKQPFTIVGDGTQTRDFTHVRDVVAANMLAMVSPRVGHGEALNIGAGSSRSVNEVAAAIGGSAYPKTYLPPRMEAQHSLADNRRARELLGWVPREQFEDGVREILALQELSIPEETIRVAA